MGTQKMWFFFGMYSPNIGAIQCAKMRFQAKICKFYVKIAAKLFDFSKCARDAQKFAICV